MPYYATAQVFGETAFDAPEEKPMQPKFPNVKVQLAGTDGNAFAVLGKVLKALRLAGVPGEDQKEFEAEATSGDYNHLLATCMKTDVG